MKTAVSYAEERNWDACLKIMLDKPYLINCIPEEKSLSVLHEAVLQNNGEYTEKLLNIGACDVLVKTRKEYTIETMFGKVTFPAGSTTLDFIEKLDENFIHVKEMIKTHYENVRKNRFDGPLSYQVGYY